MAICIHDDLLDRIQAHARDHGCLPEGGDLDALIEMTAAATRTSSAEVRQVHDQHLRVQAGA